MPLTSKTPIETMVDIETLDTRPTSVVLSMAVVTFTQDEGPIDEAEYTLEIQSQIDRGRTISEDTLINFWMQQCEEAKSRAFTTQRLDTDWALQNMIKTSLIGVPIWANSPSFDLVIIEDLFRNYGILETPWNYSKSRDVRTLRAEANIEPEWQPAVQIEGVRHTPTYDCLWQIELVRECRRRLHKL